MCKPLCSYCSFSIAWKSSETLQSVISPITIKIYYPAIHLLMIHQLTTHNEQIISNGVWLPKTEEVLAF